MMSKKFLTKTETKQENVAINKYQDKIKNVKNDKIKNHLQN